MDRDNSMVDGQSTGLFGRYSKEVQVSYIRSTSNPEGLYIWHDMSGPVFIVSGRIRREHKLPVEAFEGIMRRWGRDPFLYDDDGAGFKGATMTLNKRNWKWQLNYPGWKKPVECYQVTWEHVARNVLRRRRRK